MPGVERMASRCELGMLKIIDVERMVTTRVAELAADTASKPSNTARRAENRNTATATLIIVNAVRRLLRLALFSTRPRNFTSTSYPTRLRSPHRTSFGEAALLFTATRYPTDC